jgi:chromosomal replication initiator protein
MFLASEVFSTMPGTNAWEKVLRIVESKLNEGSFTTWFKPTEFLSLHDNSLYVRVPNKYFNEWISNNYSQILCDAAVEANMNDLKIVFLCPDESPARGLRAKKEKQPCAPRIRESAKTLNPKYTFSNFVIGPCNQFAQAAAQAVSKKPFRTYNPFFVYGGVGLGKTHLIQAIAHHVLKANNNLVVLYTPAEKFMNHLIQAIRQNKTFDFRERYRKLDILIIDDIQFLAGKERTQEEFFHTFNALFDAQKQIIISSDSPPKEIPTLEERLRSRFEWGLIADLHPPDLETKLAILKQKSISEKVPIPDDVAFFLATRIKSNIRELEGSLIRLIAFSSFLNRKIDQQFAREILKDLIEDEQQQPLSLEDISQEVCNLYGLKAIDLKSKSNSQKIAFPRQIAMYLCKNLTTSSYPQIGKFFGGKHHTTVMHSVKKIQELLSKDGNFNKVINKLTCSIKKS